MAAEQPSDVTALQDYVNQSLEKGPNGPFLPLSKLEAYFSQAWRLPHLLRALNLNDALKSTIYANFKRVFSILVLIDRAKSIREFISHGHLADRNLPFRSHDDWPDTCRAFFEQFTNLQWQFCPLNFKYGELYNRRLHDREILPIIKETRLDKGGNSRTSIIEIHPDYDDLQGQSSKGRQPNKYLLKTIRSPKNEQSYINELDTYTRLMHVDDQGNQHKEDVVVKNMIKLYGSWRQRGQFNLLLEYADHGSLQEWFEKTTPPCTPDEYIMFWWNLIQIIKPLQRLHEGLVDARTGFKVQALHQDISPANILVSGNGGSSPYDVTFKLSDFGLTRFEENPEDTMDIEARERCGTQMYSAPECLRDDAFLQRSMLWVKPCIDVWSLGCVLSEAVVWSSEGHGGLEKYVEERRHETAQIKHLDAAGYSGCFHNGETALTAVISTHARIRTIHRTSDTVVESMITIVEELLAGVENPDARPRLTDVYRRCRKMVETSRNPQAQCCLTYSQNNLLTSHPPWPPIFEDDKDENTVASTVSSYKPAPLSNVQKLTDVLGSQLSSPSTSKPPGPYHPKVYDFGDEVPRSWGELCRFPQSDRALQWQSPASTEHDLGIVSSRSTPQPPHTNSMVAPHALEAIEPHRPKKMSKSAADTSTNGSQEPTRGTCNESRELSINDAEKHIQRVKSGKNRSEKMKELTFFKECSEILVKRDQIFLIDNSASMKEFWPMVIQVFETLAYFTKHTDPDGIDLYFTNTKDCHRHHKDRDKMIRILKSMSQEGECNMKRSLARILESWYSSYEKSNSFTGAIISKLLRRKAKDGVTIYVLTDGVWQKGPKPLCQVEAPIKNIVDKLMQRGVEPDLVGIQFIRFGSSDIGLERFKLLDSGLKQYGIEKDIVDWEPCDGNVWKMLLGSFDKFWDDDADGDSNNSTPELKQKEMKKSDQCTPLSGC